MSRVTVGRPRSSSRFLARVLPDAKPPPFPGFIEPALATVEGWLPDFMASSTGLRRDCTAAL
jgi:hypothetical protein